MSEVATLKKLEAFTPVTPFIPSFESAIAKSPDPWGHSFFLQELVRQTRFHDSAELYENCPDAALLQSFIVPADAICPVERAIAPLARLQVSAFYHAIATEVEIVTGQTTQIFINLSNSELSSALIFCGNLLVVSELLRQVNCFGFESLETLKEKGEQIIKKAVTQACQYFNF